MSLDVIELTIPANYKNLSVIRNVLRTYLEIEKIANSDIIHLVSAVDELSTNVIEHAYNDSFKEEEKLIKISVGNQNDNIYISVEDYGKGFIEGKKSKEEGGMGLSIVIGIVDDFKMIKKENGTKIEIYKKVKKEER